ncbi:unnamed protein product [Urochloa decumbens]|uniref:Peptidase A1 domain-containing protein n=1 Tax=Urochloa decumbens TaxID=240449 RepID=A0ABC9AU67_9POAL
MAMLHNNTPPRELWLSCGALILSSTLVLLLASSTAEAHPPSGDGDCQHYRFELTHINANLSLSSDELMRHAYERSRLRAATLYGTGADSPAGGGGSSDSDSDSDSGSPVGPPGYLRQGDSVYNIEFYMDDLPGQVISATIDTGSNLIWTTQEQCQVSKTRSIVPCKSFTCKQQTNRECSSGQTRCKYEITYGGDKGTETRGILYKDKITFLISRRPRKERTFQDITIGCSTYVSDPSIKGIVGLGRGAQSLPGQLNFDKFSYCLNSYYKPKLPSYLLLTAAPDMSAGATSGAALATTGLRRNDAHKNRYYVDLQGISIGGTRLDVPVKSGGNMFVDTGSSFTHLEGSVFDKLVKALDQIMNGTQYSNKKQDKNGMICYLASTIVHAEESSDVLPQMVLHFADSADMVLPSDSYFWKTSKLCLAISKTEGNISVLGNFQMQGIHMLFDTQNDKLSFVPANCSEV